MARHSYYQPGTLVISKQHGYRGPNGVFIDLFGVVLNVEERFYYPGDYVYIIYTSKGTIAECRNALAVHVNCVFGQHF